MNTALAYLDFFDMNKAEITAFVEEVSGQIEARKSLPILVKLTVMEKIISGIKEKIKEQVLDEANLEGEKSFVINGVKFEKTSKSTYYYHHCTKWNELKEQLKALEDMMKAAKSPFADPETGEVIEPARSSYTEYIKVTLP